MVETREYIAIIPARKYSKRIKNKNILKVKGKMIFDKSKPYIIPSWRVQDVDNLEDWNRLELLYDLLNK